MKADRAWLLGLMLPCAAVFLVFFVIPLTRLLLIGGGGELGWSAYSAAFTEPRYLRSMLSQQNAWKDLAQKDKKAGG